MGLGLDYEFLFMFIFLFYVVSNYLLSIYFLVRIVLSFGVSEKKRMVISIVGFGEGEMVLLVIDMGI